MSDPEDRPTDSDRPVPYDDPPDKQPVPPAAGGPPGDPAGEPVQPLSAPSPLPPPAPPPPAAPGPDPAPAEPEARWEDVVDPQIEAPAEVPAEPPAEDWPAPNRVRPASRTTGPAGARAPSSPAATSTTATTERDDDYDDEYDDEDYIDEPASRWVSLLATVGTALIGIVTVQVLTSLVEGFMLDSGQRVGVPDDLFHRIGYPFGGLGATALVFLVLGVVLVSMPSVLDELLSESQDRVVGIALVVAIIMGVLIAVGSLLAVRANLHEYAAKNVPVPSYVRVQFTNFLLGSLGAAALSLFASIASINERSREQFD